MFNERCYNNNLLLNYTRTSFIDIVRQTSVDQCYLGTKCIRDDTCLMSSISVIEKPTAYRANGKTFN